LVRVRVRLKRLDGKTIGIDFISAKAYLADAEGNLYPIVGASCNDGEKYIGDFKNGIFWDGARYDKTGKKTAEYLEGKHKGSD